MLHPMVKRSIPLALSAALVIGAVPSVPTHAATPSTAAATNPVYTPAPVGKVSIGNNSYIQLQEVHLLGQTVRFTISVVNNGNSDLDFIDYWVKLRSVKGSQFTVNLTDSDKDKNRIPAKTTQTFTYYSTVSNNTVLSDLKFDFIKWDFSVASFQRYLGSVRVPVTYSTKTPAGKLLNMQINGTSATALIKKATIAKTSDKYNANLTFVFQNTGKTSIALPAYGFSIVTAEGLAYPLTVEGLEDNPSVHPRFTKELTLKGELPASIAKTYWKLVMTEKTGESPVLPMAQFIIPASTAEVVKSIPVGGKKELIIKDQKVNATVAKTIRNENDRNFLSTINFSFVNEGTEPVVLPKYTFSVKTETGLVYPVTASIDNIRLDPRVEKEVQLKVTLPNTVGDKGWKLLMQEPVDASKPDSASSTVATFDLPDENPVGLNQGSVFTYSNDDGSYGIRFDSVQRVPWEDEDILSAEFVISNPGNSSLPIPELSGYFMLDDKIKIDAKTLQKDAVIDVKPNGNIRMVIYSKIPYTYDYSSLKVALQEKTGEDTTVNVVEFQNDDDTKPLRVISVGSKHTIEGTGRRSEVKMRDVRTYEAPDINLFTVLVDVKNLEKRFTDIASLVGYFSTPDGFMYPVTVSEMADKVTPQGVATLMFSSNIPKSIDTSSLSLILGEGVSNGKFATGSETDSYVNAVSFKLPVEQKTPSSDFTDLVLFPYTVSMNNFSSRLISTDSFLFKFDYELTKNTFVDVPEDGHNLLIEFEDTAGNLAFPKKFTLDQNSDDHEESSTDLALGSYTKNFEIKDELILYKLQSLTTYKVKVYDIFNNQKRLLAEQQFGW